MPRIAMLQANPRVGDFAANLARLHGLRDRLGPDARHAYALYPDGALVGHPTHGLAYRGEFRRGWQACRAAARETLSSVPGVVDDAPEGCARIVGGGVPDFGEVSPAALAVGRGARAILVDTTRPYRFERIARYEAEVSRFAAAHRVWWIEANLAGGQVDAVLAGGSLVVSPSGAVVARARGFDEDALLFELRDDFSDGRLLAGASRPLRDEPAALRDALVVAIRDYVVRSGAGGAVIGLSGGADSAVVAALAVDALGPDRVLGITMPAPHTSRATLTDAHRLAILLGIECREMPIGPVVQAAAAALGPTFAALAAALPPDPEDLTGQNLQARARGLLLMGVANRMNRLVLNASNKSEASVGYGTLYGDLVGGYAPIVDVYKTEVWALGAFINADAGRERIPATTLDRAPTAELRPDQADTDTLPPYETLDAFLRAVNEEPHSLSLALDAGMDPATAADVVRRICRAEFKRRQGVPGPLVQASADWPERRLPILHNFWPDVLPDR